jgi:hypothetical protein
VHIACSASDEDLGKALCQGFSSCTVPGQELELELSKKPKHWFINQTSSAITLLINPWGRRYTVAPGMSVELRMMSGAPVPPVMFVQAVDATEIYIEKDDEAPQLYAGGRLLAVDDINQKTDV